MEKKKLLLVAVSVGVFLAIVISASILIFAPKASVGGAVSSGNSAGSQAAAPAISVVPPAQPIAPGTANPQTQPQIPQSGDALARHPATVDAADLVRNAGDVQNIQTPPAASAVQETNFYINGTKPADSYQVENTAGGASAKVVIGVPKPSTAAVPDKPYENRSTVAARPAERPAAPAPAKPAARPTAAAPKPATVAAKPAAKPAPRTYNDYWVQTGAFSAKVNAENAKETLNGKGITSLIENREVDGKTWYRVRVGPYTSENEANYWLALVKTIDGFAESQVRQTRSVR